MGEPPYEVIELDGAVLIETGVAGSYDVFPNGFVPILIRRTCDGWLLCDTGQTPLAAPVEPNGLERRGEVLCVRTGAGTQDLQCGIRKLIGVLRRLHRPDD